MEPDIVEWRIEDAIASGPAPPEINLSVSDFLQNMQPKAVFNRIDPLRLMALIA